MQRKPIEQRSGWREYAESVGFDYHTIGGEPYWDESAYYQFSWQQIEAELEPATEELHEMALSLVPDILASEQLLSQLGIAASHWDYLAASWPGQPQLYGRMDLCYDGLTTPKLLELNYDTPTSVFESGFFQWIWLEDQIENGLLPATADQFNSLQEKLIEAFKALALPQPFYFSSVEASSEDRGNVRYLMDCAVQAGLSTQYIPLETLGQRGGQFVDVVGTAVNGMFKLYPWEFMLAEEYASVLLTSDTRFVEPPWKALLSNKGILPLLWQKFPDHPNLLPSFFEDSANQPLQKGWVRKPLYSREGANVELVDFNGERLAASGPYGSEGYIRQQFCPLPKFYDESRQSAVYTLVGSWVVGDRAAGIALREDASLITRNSSRFLPHIILD
ncbi:MAG: glutathionylspermidine synthase family protein [Gammaproteobacteria bacterium]